MTLLQRVATRLSEEQIPFAVIGATALAAHGIMRSTEDVDLLVTSARALSRDLWATLAINGVSVDVRKGDDDDPLRGVVRLSSTSETLDIVVGKHPFQQGVLERTNLLSIRGTTLPVVSAADLVLLKLFAGGYQDRWDIQQLLVGEARPAIVAEVEARLSELPSHSEELWRTLRDQH